MPKLSINKTHWYISLLKGMSIVVVVLFLIVSNSCNKTHYGTSLSIHNLLDVEFELEVHPKNIPYSPQSILDYPPGESGTFWHTGVTDDIATDIIASLYDSITIHFEHTNFRILFTPDTAINYELNMYTSHESWNSIIVTGRLCDMRCWDTEDINYYFEIDPLYLINIENDTIFQQ